tara:strand:- start:106 stop:897 length:792 start_codon:yes stop_codon:yes gene_type:complete
MKKKKIILIGSEGKLGKTIIKKLSKENVVICADKKFSREKRFIRKKVNIFEHYIDVINEKSVKNFHDNVIKKFKNIDGIVFSVTAKSKDFYFPLENFSFQSWKSLIDIELGGAFLLAKNFGQTFAKQKFGSFVFVSSIYGIVGNDHSIYKGSNLANVYSNKNQNKKIFSNSAYNTAKGGLISFTKFLATYWVGKNVRFNCISPGGIEDKRENKTFVKQYSTKVPLRRKAKLEEITDSIIFLLSEKSKYINGHNLVVDGGFTAW